MTQLAEIKNGKIVPIRKFYRVRFNGGENAKKPKRNKTDLHQYTIPLLDKKNVYIHIIFDIGTNGVRYKAGSDILNGMQESRSL